MTPRRLSGPDAQSDAHRRGRRASDAAPAPIHAATFIVQVAGLCLPGPQEGGVYASAPPRPPAGMFRNWKV